MEELIRILIKRVEEKGIGPSIIHGFIGDALGLAYKVERSSSCNLPSSTLSLFKVDILGEWVFLRSKEAHFHPV